MILRLLKKMRQQLLKKKCKKMRLIVFNQKVQVVADKEELSVLRKKLKVYIPIFGKKNEFDVVDLYNWVDKTFPRGLLNRMVDHLEGNGIDVTIENRYLTKRNTQKLKLKQSFRKPRENQLEAYIEMIKHDQCYIKGATGSGKSDVILRLIEYMQNRTLLIVPTTDIKNKFIDEFSKYYPKARFSDNLPRESEDAYIRRLYEEDKIVEDPADDLSSFYDNPEEKKEEVDLSSFYDNETQPKSTEDFDLTDLYSDEVPEFDYLRDKELVNKKEKALQKYKKKVKDYYKKENQLQRFEKSIKSIYVVCWQSLRGCSKEFLKYFDSIIIDECHVGSASTIRNALMDMPNCGFKYSVSATPDRDKHHDQILLEAVIGDKLVHSFSGKDAVEAGVISKPEYVQIRAPIPDAKFFTLKIKHPLDINRHLIVGNITRNELIVEQAIKEMNENGNKVLITIDEVAHLEILEKRFKAKGFDIIGVHSKMNPKIKERNIEKISNSKDPYIAIGSMSIGVGSDLINVNRIILGSGGKSTIRTLQRIGRGARLSGDNTFIVYDIDDWFHSVTKRWSSERKKIFEQEYLED